MAIKPAENRRPGSRRPGGAVGSESLTPERPPHCKLAPCQWRMQHVLPCRCARCCGRCRLIGVADRRHCKLTGCIYHFSGIKMGYLCIQISLLSLFFHLPSLGSPCKTHRIYPWKKVATFSPCHCVASLAMRLTDRDGTPPSRTTLAV